MSLDVRDLVELFRMPPTATASSATEHVDRDLLDGDPMGRTRVRSSLTPESIARITDIRTSSIAERIAAIDDFVAAGHEVHLDLSPVILTPGWRAERYRRGLEGDAVAESTALVRRMPYCRIRYAF